MAPNGRSVKRGLPDTFQGDGDIAGPGVSISRCDLNEDTDTKHQVFAAFVATASLTMLLVVLLLCKDTYQVYRFVQGRQVHRE